MSSSVFKRSAGARRCSAVGVCGSRPYLSPRFEPSATGDGDEFDEVQIRWKPILNAVIDLLGGTEPLYRMEQRRDVMFQLSVAFTVPSDSWGGKEQNVTGTGTTCFSLCEAESEAAAAALQRLAVGSFGRKMLDISKLRCDELETKCHNLTVKVGDLRHVLDMVLTDWGDCMYRIEKTYGMLCRKMQEDMCTGADDVVVLTREAVAKRLGVIITASKDKHNAIGGEVKSLKDRRCKARTSMRKYFNDHMIPKAKETGEGPMRIIKISMRLVLCEMMISLGWDEPDFSTIWGVGNHLFACQVELHPKGNSVNLNDGIISVEGPDETSESEAIESAAQAAILLLEKEMYICLVDLNYNERSHAELHVSEAESVLKLTSSLIADIRSEWEGKLVDLSVCDEYCRNVLKEHAVQDANNREYYVKWECAEAIAELYEDCVLDVEQGSRRFEGFSEWVEKGPE